MSCDVGKVAEGLENEAEPHSPTLTLLHLHHSSFYNPTIALPTSQALHLCHLASFLCFIFILYYSLVVAIR